MSREPSYSATVVWENPPVRGRLRVAEIEIVRIVGTRRYTYTLKRRGYYTPSEAAAALRVTRMTLWRWCNPRRGHPVFHAVRRGGRTWIRASELVRHIEEREGVMKDVSQNGS